MAKAKVVNKPASKGYWLAKPRVVAVRLIGLLQLSASSSHSCLSTELLL